MVYVMWALAICVIAAFVAVKIFVHFQGEAHVIPQVEKRTPLAVVDSSDTHVVLETVFFFANEGKQTGTLVDVVARTQLPYEQYDGIEARGKIECVKARREDDYFEATLVERGESLAVALLVRLTARKGMDIETALSHMVDLPVDVIYTELSRRPWRLKKVRLVLTAEEIARAADVALLND